jgi:hypothetical protein
MAERDEGISSRMLARLSRSKFIAESIGGQC